jgi:nitrogen regulatory protein PII
MPDLERRHQVAVTAGHPAIRPPDGNGGPDGASPREVVAIVRPDRSDPTKIALLAEGFVGVTVSAVMGRGQQGGLAYTPQRGAAVPYLPKQMLTLLVRGHDVDRAVTTIVRANRTGEIGDGKIFVLPVEAVLRIRTREAGAKAL